MEETQPSHPGRKALRKALKTAISRARRKEEKLLEELSAADAARDLLECGEILKANLPLVPKRADSVELPDPYHPGNVRRIELDPALKPLDNAKRYFKKHRKLLDGREAKNRELDICRHEAERLEKLAERLAAWEKDNPPELPPPEDFADLAKELRVSIPQESVPEPQHHSRRPNMPAKAEVARCFTSADGLEIWVGREAADNDILTLRLAKGRDWWFHVAHHSGSHVIVSGMERSARKGERTETFLPQETLLDAAHLAVYFSKARNASRAEVHIARARDVRKAKGAPAGQVTLSQYQVLSVRIESARLERLTARR